MYLKGDGIFDRDRRIMGRAKVRFGEASGETRFLYRSAPRMIW
jgi:hypothetical protein